MDVKHFIEGSQGFVFLTKEITNELANIISAQIYAYKRQGLHPVLKINSPGGSVRAGFTIIDAITTNEADTHIIGLAASMAGVVSQFGKNRMINKHGTLHMHPPKGGDSEFLEIVRRQLSGILTSRSKINRDDIENYIGENGKDKYFDAKQTINLGLADEEVDFSSQPIELENKTPMQLYEVYNNILENKTHKMEKITEIKNALGLDSSVSENKVLESVNTLKDQVSDKETEIKNLGDNKAELELLNEQLESDIKNIKEQRATELVENAYKMGKITEDAKKEWKDLATENYELAKTTISGISNSSISVSDLIDEGSNSTKAFADLSNDEKADLARNNPDKYEKEINKLYETTNIK